MKVFKTLFTLFLLNLTLFISAQNCNNLGFEAGDFSNWDAWRGKAVGGFNAPTVLDFEEWFLPPDTTFPGIPGNGTQGLSPSQHQITTAATPLDFWTGISPLSPTGGAYSVQLGNMQSGAGAEMIQQKFLVTTSNASYIYQYAVVFEDPGHIGRPLFEIKIFDQNDSIIPCGEYLVRADQGLPGFVSTQVMTGTGNHYIVYKDWTDVAVDLSPYIGDSVTVQFATGDCNAGQHFGYAYIDGYCQVLELNVVSQNCTNVLDLTAPNGYQSYVWDNGMNGQSITVTGIPGDSIKVTMTPYMGCSTVLTHYFDSITTPIANFSANDTCMNFPIQFIDSSFTNVSSWSWIFGDGNTSTLQNPVNTYTNSGNYNVQLIVTNNAGCSDTIIKPINICANNDADFIFQPTCNQTVFFTDNSTTLAINPIISWVWNFGDSITSQDQNPSHIYIQDGSYNVSMIVTYSDNTTDTVVKSVLVLSQPIANFNTINTCLGGTINYNNASSINSGSIIANEWLFGDGNTSSQQNPNYVFNTTGMYFSQLIVTADNGCKDTVIKPVFIHQLPQSIIALSPPTGCEPVEVDFNTSCNSVDDTISFDSFDMNFSTAFTHNTPNTINGTQYIIIVSGTFNVWGDPTKLLDAAFSIDYSNSTTVASNFLASAPNNNLRPTPDVYNSSNHLYTYYFTGDGNPINFNFTDPNYTDNSGILHYDIFEINAACNNYTYSWDFGNGVNLVADSATVTYSSAGTYNIALNITNNLTGCINTFNETVIVYPNPTADFLFNIPCEGNTTNFSDQSQTNITTWIWDFGDGQTSNLQNPNNLYNSNGNYIVNLTVQDVNGCIDSTTQTLDVLPIPDVDFDSIQNGCSPLNVSLYGTSNSSISTWYWDLGNSTTSSNQNPILTYNSPGSYDVSLTVTGTNGCTNSLLQTNYITVYPNPIANFSSSPNDVTELDPTIYFTDLSQGATLWNWNLGDGATSNNQNPTHTYNGAGDYSISLYVENSYGCSDNIVKEVKIKPVFSFYIPNAFTPNLGDGINDTFKGVGLNISEFNMMIFDRWGEMIFESSYLEEGWNGTYKGEQVPNDVYVYKIKLKDVLGQNHNYIGKVIVVN